MKSNMGKAIVDLSTSKNLKPEEVFGKLKNIMDMEESLYEKVSVDLGDLIRYGEIMGRIAAANIVASDEADLLMTLHLAKLMQDPIVVILLGYAMKHGILLNLAEQQAEAFAGLTWVLAPDPEQTQESQPNQDPPVEPPA